MPKDKGDSKDHLEDDQYNTISRINIKLPQFWSNTPATWFILAEAQFDLNELLSDANKFNYVVSSLPQDVAESITDILEKPPNNNKYVQLKKVLIERHSLSIESRIKKLTSDQHMGDKKPSEFYRYLKQLAGPSGTVGEELIKKLWLSRLPHLINIAIIPQKEENLETLLKVADQIWEAMQSSNISTLQTDLKIHSIKPSSSSNNNSNDERYNHLEREIQSLKSMISSLTTNDNRSRPRSRSKSFSNNFRQRSNSNKRFNSKQRLCWYHFRYAEQAKKCIPPCDFKSKSSCSNSNSKN